VVSNISNSLVDGGILVMDYLNVPFAEQNLLPTEAKEIDGVIYDIKRWTDDRFFYKKITIENVQGSTPLEYLEQVAKLTLSDFHLMFNKYGLRIQKLFGDYRLNDYSLETSPRLIIVAKKQDDHPL
jgi:hypothetical protein